MSLHILFDLDGTLTDPFRGTSSAVLYALEKLGRPPVPRDSLRYFIGPPLSHSFPHCFGMDAAETEAAIRLYREYYGAGGLYENELYPGIPEALADLRQAGRRLYLATSKPEPFARQILDHFDLTQYFDFIGGADMAGVLATKADVIRYVLREADPAWGADPAWEAHCAREADPAWEAHCAREADPAWEAHCARGADSARGAHCAWVMVGDRKHDVIGAAECRIPCVGVLWGYGSRAELLDAGAVAVVENPAGLSAALNGQGWD